MLSRRLPVAISLSLVIAFSACSGDASTGPPSDADFAKGGKKGAGSAPPPMAEQPTQLDVYGVWHCGNDYCTWGTVRDVRPSSTFDTDNHWLIDRGDGRPSVNLVVLSFVNPLELLNETTEADPLAGIPVGMTQEVVDYFTSADIRVMLSIGGITYVDDWNAALASNPTQLGLNAAKVASELGVGIEIDYEENTNPDTVGLQAFITAYRSVHKYDAGGTNPAARLTIDLAAGDRWLIALTRHATLNWLSVDDPVLDYANAMVPNRQPGSADDAIANWYEHIEGKPRYDPPIPALAPAKFTGSLYIVTGKQPAPECVNFPASLQNATSDFVQRALPNPVDHPDASAGMLGYMFWAAGSPSPRRISTAPPNSCEGGVGLGASTFDIPIAMEPLRQH